MRFKIFSIKKDRNRTFFYFFNLNYCIKFTNEFNTRYKKLYFNKILKSYRVFDSSNYRNIQYIYFLNVLFLKKEEDGEYINFYLFNKLIKKFSIEEYIKKHFLPFIDKSHDRAYILNANSGEIYLFLMFLFDTLNQKDNIKNPIFIATKSYHIDLIKMICPEIPYIFTKKFYTNIKKEKFYIEGIEFQEIFVNKHFKKVETKIKTEPTNTVHYFDEMKKTLQLNNLASSRQIKCSIESTKTALKKVQDIGLNLNNFVIISPEANSCLPLPIKFWEELILKLQEKGYDIFVNTTLNRFNTNKVTYKSCFLTYSEAFAIAKYAKKIYSLRSGFTEFLLNTNVPIEIYYTPFAQIPSAILIKHGFGVDKLPDVNMNLIKEVIIK